ncbi:MAG: hypothetical protein WKF91_23700, partial [Segetibacter sp.]
MMKRLKICCVFFFLIMKVVAQNYDEAKVPLYTLPDLLKTATGSKVTNKSSWEKNRRPEVLQLFEKNIYGQMPKAFDSIHYTVTNDVSNAMGGKAHLKEVT